MDGAGRWTPLLAAPGCPLHIETVIAGGRIHGGLEEIPLAPAPGRWRYWTTDQVGRPRRREAMKLRREALLTLTAGLVAVAVIIMPVLAEEPFGVITQVDSRQSRR